MDLSSIYVKLVGGLVAALVLVGLVFGLRHYKSLAESRGQKLELVCKTTREAAEAPKLSCGNIVVQIQELGASLKTTTAALNDQNARVAELGNATKQQQAQSAAAVKAAAGRAQKAETTSARLAASSRSGAAQAKPCDASKALQEAWK